MVTQKKVTVISIFHGKFVTDLPVELFFLTAAVTAFRALDRLGAECFVWQRQSAEFSRRGSTSYGTG